MYLEAIKWAFFIIFVGVAYRLVVSKVNLIALANVERLFKDLTLIWAKIDTI